MFIVEPKGLTLEETAALFDGEEAVERIHARARPTSDEDTKESISEREGFRSNLYLHLTR